MADGVPSNCEPEETLPPVDCSLSDVWSQQGKKKSLLDQLDGIYLEMVYEMQSNFPLVSLPKIFTTFTHSLS